jgi:hypothetical protein
MSQINPFLLQMVDEILFYECLSVPAKEIAMAEANGYKYLEAWPTSCTSYRGLYVKGHRLRVEDLYRETVGVEPRNPSEVASAFDVPLEAVLEAIDYCMRHDSFLREEREREMARIREYEKLHPPPVPSDYQPER